MGEFNDWVITTAFYASMHYLRHAIFPIKVNQEGSEIEVTGFEEYCVQTKKRGKRHNEMRKLVECHCPTEVAAIYNQMLDLSWTARYSKYRFSAQATNTAIKRLEKIKTYSESK